MASVFILSTLVGVPAMADGPGGTGGGSGHASKFYDVAKNAVLKLKMICTTDPYKSECQYLAPLREALLDVTVKAEDVVLGPDGRPRDAGNNGRDVITVSKSAMDKTSPSTESAERWVRTALHELAVIKDLEANDTYSASNQAVNLIKNEGFDLTKIAGDIGVGFIVPKANQTGINFEKANVNSDGSVTFSDLTFTFRGRRIRIQPELFQTDDRGNRRLYFYVGMHFCKRVGMDYLNQEDTSPDQIIDTVQLNGTGQLSSVRGARIYVESITCSKSEKASITELSQSVSRLAKMENHTSGGPSVSEQQNKALSTEPVQSASTDRPYVAASAR
ncbi:MAG: hypothetical protein A2Z97_07610 [Bdellovibrionales bacterium GWB1_52_6]|nr:MAG: hypothetical protein A2Z97_07610 [Bdellovibrionales bacterium GWB1_52_6]